MKKAAVELNLCEVDILRYLLNGRVQLGDHADSVKRKLNAAHNKLLKAANEESESITPPQLPEQQCTDGIDRKGERNREFNKWDRRRESSAMTLLQNLGE